MVPVKVIFNGPVWTSYGQLIFRTGSKALPLPTEAFLGQVNGLCGAAVPGTLFLVTGTHTGEIPLRVTLWESEPELGEWEEIVETSLIPAGVAELSGWMSDPVLRFALPAPCYRARWNASGMDAAHDDRLDEGDSAPDSYELMLWPAPPAQDAILSCISGQAAYWHEEGFPHGRGP